MTRPALPSAFHWRRESWGDALACGPLETRAQHVFTTRQLQLHSPDADDAWRAVVDAVSGSPTQLLRVKQVHGRTVRVVREQDLSAEAVAARPEADAIVSNVSGAVLAVQVADCVPMLMVDARVGAAAAVHAGWRGTAAGITGAAIHAMTQEFGSRPEDVIVALGPSIGACCYEVGDELIGAFASQGAGPEQINRWFSRNGSESLRLDLWRANADLLMAEGIREEHIHLSRLCTQTYSDVFDSYRAAGARAGRMIAAIKVPRV